MSKNKGHQNGTHFRERLEQHADQLESAAHAARVMALAEDELDCMVVVVDLLRAVQHSKAARHAHASGERPPEAPAPISKLLTRFTASLREKVEAVSVLLTESERSRLVAIGPEVMRRLERRDDEACALVAVLMPHSAQAIAWCLGMTLPMIETRFAS